MPISQDSITTLDQLEEKLTLALTDLLLLRDSNNEDYKVKASTILQAAVDKAGAELIGGNVESGNTKAVTGDTVNTALSSYAKSYEYDATKLDFNEFITSGFYRIGNLTNYSNAPSGASSYGQLIVSRNGDTILQMYSGFSSESILFQRCFNIELTGGVTWQRLARQQDIKRAYLLRAESDNPLLQVGAISDRPCSIIAFGYDGINIIKFTGGLTTGVVEVVYGSAFITYDTSTGRIGIKNTNREVDFILPNNKSLTDV